MGFLSHVNNRCQQELNGFWCRVYFPDMLNLMTQTSGKQLNETFHAVVIVRNEI